jgi:hypothetical protein
MEKMRSLKWWMRLVGGFYILLGLINTPPVIAARIPIIYPYLSQQLESAAVQLLIDVWFMFGVEILVMGAMLLVASQSPWKNRILVYTILWLELTRGIGIDLYWITRGLYDNTFYIGFAIVHLIIILTGWVALANTRRSLQERE